MIPFLSTIIASWEGGHGNKYVVCGFEAHNVLFQTTANEKNLLFKQKAIRAIDMVHIMPFFSFVI